MDQETRKEIVGVARYYRSLGYSTMQIAMLLKVMYTERDLASIASVEHTIWLFAMDESLNPYDFVHNSPLDRIDPFGTSPWYKKWWEAVKKAVGYVCTGSEVADGLDCGAEMVKNCPAAILRKKASEAAAKGDLDLALELTKKADEAEGNLKKQIDACIEDNCKKKCPPKK